MSNFNKILAFDTVLQACRVAAVCGEREAVRVRDEPHGQAEHLMPMIEGAMDEAGLEYGALDAIVTTIGPGAFTGLRIGLSAAKALAMSAGVPLYGVSSLQVVAAQFARDHAGRACNVALETKRQDFYFQSFDEGGAAACAAQALSLAEIEGRGGVYIGDGAERLRGEAGASVEVIQGYEFIDPAFLARMLRARPEVFVSEVSPLYLRGADVSQSKNVPRRLAEV